MSRRTISRLSAVSNYGDSVVLTDTVVYREPQITPAALANSRAIFLTASIALMAVALLGVNPGLEALYSLGRMATIGASVLAIGLVVLLFLWQSENTYVGLAIGLLLWTIVGEIAGKLGYADVCCMKNAILLALVAALVTYLAKKDVLPWHLMTALMLFVILWSSRFIVVNVVGSIGARHPITCMVALAFPLLLVCSSVYAWKSKDRQALTICSMFIAASIWATGGFLHAWQWIALL